ncbi:MAG: hypothetical protein AAF721_02375 [Myxococcota bacterium]
MGIAPAACDGQVEAEDRALGGQGSGCGAGSGSGSSSGSGSGCGSSSSSTADDDGGWDPSVPDAGDGGWEPMPDAGSGYEEEEEDPTYGCFIVGTPATTPLGPHKVDDYWDQGRSNLCAAIAWVNANIDAGADQVDGADPIILAVLNCMAGKGHNIQQMVRDGMTNGQRADLRECKEEEMEDRELPVSIEHHNFLQDGGEAKLLCEEIHDVLHPDNAVERPGAAVAAIGHFVWPDNMVELPRFVGHQVQILDTVCVGITMQITIRDPNYPSLSYTITVDCYNNIIDTGGHPRFQLGDQIADLSIETPG